MKKAYQRCIVMNPSFWFRRFIRGLKTGEFFWDAYYAMKLFFMPDTGSNIKTSYYAQERWPKWDFKICPPEPAYYQIVKKQNFNSEKKLETHL